jgi:RNA 2',3'-cyclic 3'-phosphodiesterase
VARDRAARPEARPLRLFVAVDVPEAEKDVVAGAVGPWRERAARGRWTPRENWHVTLKFLGSTWPRLVDWVMETVGRVAANHEVFETAVEGLGAFPSRRRARVLWAGLADVDGRFASLATDLDAALAREFREESRPFAPHLTVARFDPPASLGDELASEELRGRSFRVDRLVVYRSHLQRPAPRYEPLQGFPLGG